MNVRRHIFNFIADHHARWNHIPSQAAIRKCFANVTDDVDLHLEQLQREGLLKLGGAGGGTISIPNTFPSTSRINLSNPSLVAANATDDPLVRSSIGLDLRGAGITLDGDLFAQVVSDNSMIDAGIAANDIAVLKVTPPDRGEIVAVMKADRLVLRRYIIVAGIPHLLAENPVRPDLTVAYDRPTYGVLEYLICTRPNGRSRSAPPVKKVNYIRDGCTTLESEFVAMLKIEARKQITTKQRGTKSGFVVMLKPGAKKKTGSKCRNDWPEPPSGIGLNDRTNPERRATPQGAFRDEILDKAYGRPFAERLARAIAQQAEQEPSIPKSCSLTSGAAGSTCIAHGKSAKAARRARSNQASKAKATANPRKK